VLSVFYKHLLNPKTFHKITSRTVLYKSFICNSRLKFIGRLDTWNTNWLEIESIRKELHDCNLDILLWEQFDSQSREEDAFRLVENGAHMEHAVENIHGAEYVE
jgi:hypothetical protein